MTIASLLTELETLGIHLWLEAGQLKFRAPTGTLDDELRGRLRAHKQALVAHLERQLPQLEHNASQRYQSFPLTEVQAAYLVGRGEAYDYGGVGCHGYVELALDHVDPQQLNRAWRQLVARHDMLRAVISREGYQRVLEEVTPLDMQCQDLQVLNAGERQAALQRTREDMSHRVYDPQQWPLYDLRLSLLDNGAILHFSIDLLIADFISIQTLLSELDILHRTPQATLPPLDIGFCDLVLHQRAMRDYPQQRACRERDEAYWRERLADMPSPPQLPLQETSERRGEARFRRWQTRLDAEAWRLVGELARHHHLTPSAVVLAAFTEVLGRWSQEPDFILNVTVLNRPPYHPDVNRVVGDFTAVNVLAVHSHAEDNFSEHAGRLQRRLWEDLEHPAFSGLEVLREMGRAQDQRAVMVPVVYTSTLGMAEDSGSDEFMSGGRLGYGISQTPQVWIDCQVSERAGMLHVNWDVREGVFPGTLIEDAFETFSRRLQELSAPAAWECRDSLALPAKLEQQRQRVNATDQPLPQGACLHDGFLRQVRMRPDATALIHRGDTFSYRQLAVLASGVAQALREREVVPAEPVAIMLDKGVEQIAAVLGVLMAGAAYLPIGTTQPEARRNLILADADVRFVFADGASGEWPASVERLDVTVKKDAGRVPEIQAQVASSEQMAYVIYTSGTTGQPKGVMISHRAALNTVEDVNQRLGLTAEDRLLGLASLSFDLSVYDIFGAFGAGATLVLPDASQGVDPSSWADSITRHRVTIWNSVPAQMQMLASYWQVEHGDHPTELRAVLLSGDWVPVTLPAEVRSLAPQARVISMGGATEAAIWSIWHEVLDVEPEARSIPYGKPMANQYFHVLDRCGRHCPDWVAGELYIGGAGLALGYLNDQERTAQRFIIRDGERLYRTGDLGRYRDDGVIEFMGREDTQVKVRGHRVELNEIESLLQEREDVTLAVVVTQGEANEKRLHAYVEPARGDGASDAMRDTSIAREAMSAGEAVLGRVERNDFRRWVELADRIALNDILATLQCSGLFTDEDCRHDMASIVAKTGTAERHQRLMRRWLAALCREGWLICGEDACYRLGRPQGGGDADWQALRELEQRVGYGTELLRYLRESAAHLPELLQGRLDPLELLFPQGGLDTALAAYNDNLVNRSLNQVLRAALCERIQQGDGRPLRVLEIGAGVGGTSNELIPALDGQPVEYLFTDVSTFFLNEARQRYAQYPWVGYDLFDLNQPYWEQGLKANDWDVIVCANVLHNARNAPQVLERLREMMVPGGLLLVIEATREIYSLLTSMEFKEGLHGFTDERQGVDQTFLSREQWERYFRQAGTRLMGAYPQADDEFSLAGQTAFVVRMDKDRQELRAASLYDDLKRRLPDYMRPHYLEVLDSIPLTANGKVDRKQLVARAPRGGTHGEQQGDVSRQRAGDAPKTDLERRIALLWATALGRENLARDEDFFAAGGDSLLIAQVIGRMRAELPEAANWEWDRLMRAVMQMPTVASIAEQFQDRTSLSQDKGNAGADGERGDALVTLVPAAVPRPSLTRVLLHDGSGTLAPYHSLVSWMRSADPDHELLGISLVDDQEYLRLPSDQLIETLASRYARRLLEQGGQCFELVGYCMGGLLAVETARVLLEAGAQVAITTVISSDRFHYRVDDDLLLERAFGRLLGADIAAAGHVVNDERLERALRHVMEGDGCIPAGSLQRLEGSWDDVASCYRTLAERESHQRLADLAAAIPARTEAFNETQVSALYRVFRHSLAAVSHYRPAPFIGDLRVLCDNGSIHFLPGLRSDMSTFWHDMALGNIELTTIEGNHMTCMKDPGAKQVARLLSHREPA